MNTRMFIVDTWLRDVSGGFYLPALKKEVPSFLVSQFTTIFIIECIFNH